MQFRTAAFAGKSSTADRSLALMLTFRSAIEISNPSSSILLSDVNSAPDKQMWEVSD